MAPDSCGCATELPWLEGSLPIAALTELPAGEPIGYGGRFVTEGPTRVGVVAMGYADGYPQNAPSGTTVAIDGRPGKLIGRVSLDMRTVDLTAHLKQKVEQP